MTAVIRFADRPPTRWANGLGETVELWRTPADGDYDARLSIATVDSDAPFSPLPGVDRVLMALAPAGLVLSIDGVRHPLRRYETARFPGEADVRAIDVEQAGYDLNLMVRRGAGDPRITREPVDGSCDVAGIAVVLEGALSCDGIELGFGDAVLGDPAEPVTLVGIGAIARIAYL
jgi:uncharacterized protein